VNGNGDLAKLSSFVAGHEKNVEAFTQSVSSDDEFWRLVLFRKPARAGTVKPGLGFLIPPTVSEAVGMHSKPRNQAS
jgi:hypothetical protein